jgi:hypothetical protein
VIPFHGNVESIMDVPSPPEPKPVPHVLLIDVDNCPNEVGKLHELVDRFDRVVAAYAGASPKVPLSLVSLLAEALAGGTLELVGIDHKRKNAADFALAFQAGRLSLEMPAHTEFVVLSDDSDLDNVVELLRKQGFSVCRSRSARWNAAVQVDYVLATRQYLEGRLVKGLTQPRRRATLRKSIRSFFKAQPEIEPDRVIDQLIRQQLVRFDTAGEATYQLPDETSKQEDAPPLGGGDSQVECQ